MSTTQRLFCYINLAFVDLISQKSKYGSILFVYYVSNAEGNPLGITDTPLPFVGHV